MTESDRMKRPTCAAAGFSPGPVERDFGRAAHSLDKSTSGIAGSTSVMPFSTETADDAIDALAGLSPSQRARTTICPGSRRLAQPHD